MDEAKEAKIRALASAHEAARMKWENFRMRNTAGLDWDGRVKLAADAAVAEVEMMQTYRDLRAAMEETP